MKIYGNFLGERLIGGSLLTVGCGESICARVALSEMLNTESFRQGEDPCEYQSHPYAFLVEADGVDLSGTYVETDFQDVPLTDGSVHTIRTLVSEAGALEVKVHTVTDPVAEDGQVHSLRRYLEITNRKDGIMTLGHVQVFGGCLFASGATAAEDRPYRIGYLQDGGPRREGDLVFETLLRGDFSLSRRRYTERFRLPYALLQNTVSGENLALHLGFSGNFTMSFHNFYVRIPGSNNLSCSIDFGGQAPIRVLEAGETVITPSVHLTYATGDIDTLVQHTHDHVRVYASPWKKHMTLEATSMAKCDRPVQKAIALGRDLGADLFFIDAGWYIPKEGSIDRWPAYTGDWTREVDTYETTLDDYREQCYALGMKFGLWMDVEKIGFDTEIARSGKLKYIKNNRGETLIDGPCSYMVDLTDDATAAWVYESMCHVIDRYRLDFFRIDSGVYAGEGRYLSHGIPTACDWLYYERLYDIVKRIREKYPDLIFQNCAGGGMRLDLGMVAPCSNTWISDETGIPDSFRILNGVTMLLPGEWCNRLIYGMGAPHGKHPYFKLNTARFAAPICGYSEVDGVEDAHNDMCDPAFLAQSRKMFAMHRDYIRPLMGEDRRWYHHTPCVALGKKGERGILEVASRDGRCDMIAVFTLGEVIDPKITLSMRGVSEKLTYAVYANDEPIGDYTGAKLKEGLTVELPEMYDSVCLIAVEKSCLKRGE